MAFYLMFLCEWFQLQVPSKHELFPYSFFLAWQWYIYILWLRMRVPNQRQYYQKLVQSQLFHLAWFFLLPQLLKAFCRQFYLWQIHQHWKIHILPKGRTFYEFKTIHSISEDNISKYFEIFWNPFLESFTFDNIINSNKWGASNTSKNIFLNPITPFDWRFSQVHFSQNFLDHFLEMKIEFFSRSKLGRKLCSIGTILESTGLFYYPNY